MESKKNKTQWIIECDLCTTDIDVKWKCTDCEEILCTQCRTAHATSKVSSHHRIKVLTDSDYKAKRRYKIGNCDNHPLEVYVRFCTDCKMLVCVECITEKHNKHILKQVQDFIDQQFAELNDNLNIIKDRNLKQAEEIVSFIQENICNYEKDMEETVRQIDLRTDALKQEADKARDKLVGVLEEIRKQDLQKLQIRKQKARELVEEMNVFVRAKEENQNSSQVLDIVNSVDETRKKLHDYDMSSKTPKLLSAPTFVTADKIPTKFVEFLGHILDKQVKVLSKFDLKHKPLRVTAISDSEAVVSDIKYISYLKQKGGSMNLSTDKDLLYIKTIGQTSLCNDCNDIASTGSGDLIIAGGHRILQLATKYSLVMIICEIPGGVPKAVCVTESGDILVLLIGNLGDLAGRSIVSYYLQRLSSTGKTKQEKYLLPLSDQAEINKQFNRSYGTWSELVAKSANSSSEKERSIQCFITSNIDTNIWMSLTNEKYVLVIDENGKQLFTYSGCGVKMESEFIPYGLTHNRSGQIIIADRNNSALHLLDKEGKFLLYLMSWQDKICQPVSISMAKSNNDVIWVTDENKKMVLAVDVSDKCSTVQATVSI